jgi:hypothetical protein
MSKKTIPNNLTRFVLCRIVTQQNKQVFQQGAENKKPDVETSGVLG